MPSKEGIIQSDKFNIIDQRFIYSYMTIITFEYDISYNQLFTTDTQIYRWMFGSLIGD